MKKVKFYLLLVFSALLFVPSLHSQVTIGNSAAPDKFSLLDLVTTNVKKGIHMPRLTTAERDALISATAADSIAAKGLAVFNTTTNCYDVWNGKQWLSLCDAVDTPPQITVQPRAFNWKETTASTTYTGVTSPTNPAPLSSASISVTAAGATSYQWYEVSRTGLATVASGTNNGSSYTPVGTSLGMKEYYCVVSNAFGSVKSDIAKVAVGCGALTMDGAWRAFMCYNLGATKTSIADQLSYANNLYYNGGLGHTPATAAESDSAVFGNLWQWGRISDGHQRRSSGNSPTTNVPAPGTYTGLDVAWESGGSEQVRSDSVRYYGKFIINSANATGAPYDWNRNPSGRNVFLWRNHRYTQNDPCTHVTNVDGGNSFWRVPTQEEWADIWRGGMSASNPSTSTGVNTANKWVWKAAGTSTNGGYGTPAGYEIKPDGVTTTLFLPAAGHRHNGNGQLHYPGVYGYYWSTTAYGGFSYYLAFNSGSVVPAYFHYRADGFSVRCIAEL